MVLQAVQPDLSSSPDFPSARDGAQCQLLTVNVEDYFQVGAFRKFISADHWYRFESRLQQNIEQVLELLDQHGTQATFFVLGWIAEKQPDLIRRIADAGHEVASRGYLHRQLHSLSAADVREDLTRSKSLIEDVTGHPVVGFRLSDGWMTKESLWLLDEIAAAGYRYDSSLMPRRTEFGSDSRWRTIHQVDTTHGSLLEVPLSTLPVPGAWLPVAGGNYQRQVPNFVMRRLVDRTVATQTDPFVMYFQVWELDDQQPRLSIADRFTSVRHYRKLGKYRRILPEYLQRYRFTSIRDHAAAEHSPLHSLAPAFQAPCVTNTAATAVREAVHVSDVPEDSTKSDTSSATRTEITILIPCFNEETSVGYLSNTLSSVKERLSSRYKPQILFVDDCSTDRTFEMLQQQFGDDPSVSIVRHHVNQGVSAAILTGLSHAQTEVVCSMDCDCSYDPHELAHMLPLLTDEIAMVTASPYHRDGQVRNVPGWRLFLSRGLSFLYQRLLKQKLSTWTSCFRVYRRSRILDLPLQETGFLGTAELAAQLVLRRRGIAEYPATLEVRLFGISKMKTVRTIVSHLRLLTRIATSRFNTRSVTDFSR